MVKEGNSLEQIISECVANKIVKELPNNISIPYIRLDTIIPDYNEKIKELVSSIDFEEVLKETKILIQKEMARAVANKVITEFSGDIKKILGEKSVRDDVRSFLRKSVIKSLDEYCESE